MIDDLRHRPRQPDWWMIAAGLTGAAAITLVVVWFLITVTFSF